MFDTNFVKKHVSGRLPDYQLLGEPKALSGGLLNFVWHLPARPHDLVVKYTPPFMASQPEVALPQQRAQFEAQALNWVENKLVADAVGSPSLLDFDSGRNIIISAFIPHSWSLSEWVFQSDESQDAYQQMGAGIGMFIGQLHAKSFGNTALKSQFDNHNIQTVRQAVEYNIDPDVLAPYSPNPRRVVEEIKDLGTFLVNKKGICLTMGDLWLQSVLVRPDKRACIIDWELAHFGFPFQDFAHFFIHLWMHSKAAPPEIEEKIQHSLHGFVQAYKAAIGPLCLEFFSEAALRRHRIHAGVEILLRTIGAFRKGYLFEGLKDSEKQALVATGISLVHRQDLESLLLPLSR